MLAERDWVVASLHSAFDRNPTERVLTAMENPHVDCIGHLTARKINIRPPADVDIERVVVEGARDRHVPRDQLRSRTGSTSATRMRGSRARPA